MFYYSSIIPNNIDKDYILPINPYHFLDIFMGMIVVE
jgi:hypothetical protein